jgi:hypothetical protein
MDPDMFKDAVKFTLLMFLGFIIVAFVAGAIIY